MTRQRFCLSDKPFLAGCLLLFSLILAALNAIFANVVFAAPVSPTADTKPEVIVAPPPKTTHQKTGTIKNTAPEKKAPPFDKLAGPEVKIYLRDGGDITGELLAFEPTTLLIKTKSGIKPIALRQYYGMLLTTPEELAFGEKMTRNEDAFVEAVSYTQKIRPVLEQAVQAQLDKWPDVCQPKASPIMHFRINRDGSLDLAQLIAKSNCPQYNLAVAQAAKQVKFPPLAKAYPFEMYVFNYFYRPVALSKPSSQDSAKKQAASKPTGAKPAAKSAR